MLCPECQIMTRPFGRNRNGSQRRRCPACRRTFTDPVTRPADRRRLSREKLVLCLRMILEGNSIRSTERLTGVHRDTIMAALVETGEKCERFMARTIKDIPATDVQADEIWGFVKCKERTREKNGYGDEVGDAWCFIALDRTSKLVLAWHLDKRTPMATVYFAAKLNDATAGRFQLSTDGFRPYQTAIPLVFGQNIDYAQLIKTYGETPDRGPSSRYSPGAVIDVQTVIRIGQPDEGRICTSHAERQNLSMRMGIRRLTRLTNGHSKKWENHHAAMALWFAYYNFCRVHGTIKTTPTIAAGLTDHTWSVGELLNKIRE